MGVVVPIWACDGVVTGLSVVGLTSALGVMAFVLGSTPAPEDPVWATAAVLHTASATATIERDFMGFLQGW